MSWIETQFYQSLNAQSVLVVGLAFLGGMVSSVLPCTIAMLPVMVGYVGGYSEDSRVSVFIQASMFILGLATVMTVLGVVASLLGLTFGAMIGSGWYYFVGVLALLMGFNLLGIIHVPLPQFVTRYPETQTGRFIAPYLLGVTFGAASSPCGTPFLAGILGLMSSKQNILIGGASLFCYALGQGVLLLVVGLFTGLLKHMAILRHVGSVVNKLSAMVFMLVGVMLILAGTGSLTRILAFLGLF